MNQPSHEKIKPWMHFLLLSFLLLIAWSVQSVPHPVLAIAGVNPVLLLSLVVSIGVVYGELIGGICGLCAGVLMEIYASPSVGFHIVLLTGAGIAGGLLIRHVFMNTRFATFVLTLLICFIYFFVDWLLYEVILGGNGGLLYFFRFSLPAAGYTALFGFICCPLLKWLYRYW